MSQNYTKPYSSKEPVEGINVTEYHLNSDTLSIAQATENQYAHNTVGDEYYHVISGTGYITIDQTRIDLTPGMLIHIPANAQYRSFGDNLNVVITNTPPFDSSKHFWE